MGFNEKCAMACLVSVGFVYVPYFVLVFQFPMAALGLFWVAVIGLVFLLTGFHIINAIATPSIRSSGDEPPFDELDRRIELNAAKWSSLTLACTVTIWTLVAMYSIPVISNSLLDQTTITASGPSAESYLIPMFTAMTAVQWLFAGFVLANIVYYGGIVFGYRRLASA